MTSLQLPDYEAILDILDETELQLHPSEAHGLMTGIMCGHLQFFDWQGKITGIAGKSAPELDLLYELTHKQLSEFLFDFQLLLPSDEVALPFRAEALTLWSQGFLTGLKLIHVQLVGREPGELTEAIDDLLEVSKMDYEEVVESEEDEVAYGELVEYIRMAVILIYQSLSETDGPKKEAGKSQRLH